MPEALLRALDVPIGRRIEGLLAGRLPLGRCTARAPSWRRCGRTSPGDDVRHIDWDVTARTGEPHVRVHLAERVLVTWLVLDTSASMQFGTGDRRKADVAEGVALAVGHLATRRGNRLGRRHVRRPRAARAAARSRAGSACSACSARSSVSRATAASAPPRSAERSARVGGLARQRSFVVVVSDFRGPHDWRRPLLELAGRHHVLALEIRDPREQELPNMGELWLVDPETGRQLRVDTRSARLRARFAAAAADERGHGREDARIRRACATSC